MIRGFNRTEDKLSRSREGYELRRIDGVLWLCVDGYPVYSLKNEEDLTNAFREQKEKLLNLGEKDKVKELLKLLPIALKQLRAPAPEERPDNAFVSSPFPRGEAKPFRQVFNLYYLDIAYRKPRVHVVEVEVKTSG